MTKDFRLTICSYLRAFVERRQSHNLQMICSPVVETTMSRPPLSDTPSLLLDTAMTPDSLLYLCFVAQWPRQDKMVVECIQLHVTILLLVEAN